MRKGRRTEPKTPSKRASLHLACPYCGAYREHKGHRFPPDDCCLPRALEQVGWMLAIKRSREEVRERLTRLIGRIRQTPAEKVERALARIRERDLEAAQRAASAWERIQKGGE